MSGRSDDSMPEDPMLTLDFEEIPGIDVIAGELVPRYRPSAHARQYR